MGSRDFLPWHVVVFAVLVLALFGAGPFFLGSNVLAQLFFNVIMAIATTVVSIYATRHYAANQARAELIRYGLQAWRALNFKSKFHSISPPRRSRARRCTPGSWTSTEPSGRGKIFFARSLRFRIDYR